MNSTARDSVVAVLGVAAGAAVAVALRLDFHELNRDGIYRYHKTEPQWYKIIGATGAGVALGGYLVARSRIREGWAASFGFLFGLLVVVGWKLAGSRVVGGNFWMLGLPLFAVPAVIVQTGSLYWIRRVTQRNQRP